MSWVIVNGSSRHYTSVVDSAGQRFTYVIVSAAEKRRATVNIEPGSSGETVQMAYTPAAIGVMALDASTYPDRPAASRIEKSLNDWSRSSQFALLERSKATVAGGEAEFIVYLIDPPFSHWPLEYRAEAWLDRTGLQFRVTAGGDVENAEAVRADFDHVLQTLKILE